LTHEQKNKPDDAITNLIGGCTVVHAPMRFVIGLVGLFVRTN